jgi:hypothetical protein
LARRLLEKIRVNYPDEDDDERSPEEEQDDLTQAELGAVSEHSLRSAGYTDPTEAAQDAGYDDDSEQRDDDLPDETPAGMGRNLLEEATEAPGSKGPRGANDTRPSEEAAVHTRPGPAR